MAVDILHTNILTARKQLQRTMEKNDQKKEKKIPQTSARVLPSERVVE
jgi:hypothetical protein